MLVPILFPVATAAGIHPIHFGVITIVNLMMGLLSPPFGMALYTTQSVGKCDMVGLLKEVWPFIVGDLVVLFIISAFPEIVLALPRLFGMVK